MANPHGPNRLDNYIEVHRSYMDRFLAEGFVAQDGCDFTHLRTEVHLDGTIYCLGDIQIEVEKNLEILSGRGAGALVQTRYFRYNAWLKNVNNILRYDSACDHRALPHKHTFDTFGGGRELELRELATSADVPHLDDVIREVQGWYDLNRHRLDARSK